MNEQICVDNCRKLDALSEKVSEETAANHAEHDSFKRRLGALEESSKEQNQILVTLQKQADAIESMNGKIDGVAQSVSKVAGRLDEIEKEPGENWKKISFEIVK